jgi:type IV pilus assembly protein PilB
VVVSSAKVKSAKKSVAEAANNLRRFRRRGLRLPVQVIGSAGQKVAGTGSDLSLGGLRFASTQALDFGSEWAVLIELSAESRILTGARVAWVQPTETETETEHGLQFENLNDNQRLLAADAVYSPASTASFDTVPEGGEQSAASALAARYHTYYFRLIRRIEQIHSISPPDIDRLLFAVLQQGRDLPSTLLEFGLTTYDRLKDYLSALYSVPYADSNELKPDTTIIDLIPESIAFSQNVVPLRRTDGKYVVAMADPLDLPTRDIVHLRTKNQFELRFAFIEDIERTVKAAYQAASLHAADRLIDQAATGSTIQLFKEEKDVADLETLRRLSDATPIISLVDSLLRSAVEERASDVHLEPVDDAILVRFRLDGILHEMRTLPKSLLASVVSRIKIMASLDITERHVPQDGRFSMRYGGRDYELRIACIPTVFGEKIVLRLLEKNPTFKTLRSIGFSERNYRLFAPLIRRPYGMILFCGPTGSGKSTTLFACIQEIHDGTTNIMTVEDPVEYRVRGINHVELNPKRGLTFPTVLRSLLRSDPDVIYVGEIRDRETSDLAVRGALTGHLLFSTLHTNSAIQAITRLVDIGVEGSLIGASLIGVVGQRLARKVCGWCKESYSVPASEAVVLQDLLRLTELPRALTRGRGCAHCHDTGYYGRSAVHEVVVVDEQLRHLIGTSGSDATALRDHLATTDFQDLRTDAIARLLEGETTLQEVIRVTV